MAPILMHHALKATTPFVDASVNKRLRQCLPSINECLLQFGDRRKASMLVNQLLKCPCCAVWVMHNTTNYKLKQPIYICSVCMAFLLAVGLSCRSSLLVAGEYCGSQSLSNGRDVELSVVSR